MLYNNIKNLNNVKFLITQKHILWEISKDWSEYMHSEQNISSSVFRQNDTHIKKE